jgi:hypothetical protein
MGMIGERVEKKADEKGRIYIPEYRGKKIYLVDTDSTSLAF